MFLYKKCVNCLNELSPGAMIYILLHKMDLVPKDQRDIVYQSKLEKLRENSVPFNITGFQTSIWEDTLYKAWSSIVHTLIPNSDLIDQHLTQFMNISEAQEVVLFERATFLDISHVTRIKEEDNRDEQRYERISSTIKMFQLCLKTTGNLQNITIFNTNFNAFIYEFTSNTYIMVIVSDLEIQPMSTLLNIKNIRPHFEKLLKTNTINSYSSL